MRNNRVASWMLVFVLVAAADPSAAGPTDTPAPVIAGEPTRVIFIVPGVTKNNSLETLFICTSLERNEAIYIGVEIFAGEGGPPLNDVTVGDGVVVVQPGGSATIATGSTDGFHEDTIIGGLTGTVKSGSGRVVSTSKRIVCTASVTDEVSVPPASVASLRVYSPRNHDH